MAKLYNMLPSHLASVPQLAGFAPTTPGWSLEVDFVKINGEVQKNPDGSKAVLGITLRMTTLFKSLTKSGIEYAMQVKTDKFSCTLADLLAHLIERGETISAIEWIGVNPNGPANGIQLKGS